MTHRTAHPATAADAPPDIATMRATTHRTLSGNALADDAAATQTLVSTLRGHLEVILPEVETLANRQDDYDMAMLHPVACALVACADIRRMLDAEPRTDLYSLRRTAERLARRLAALIVHYETLGGGTVVTQLPPVCRHCDEPITDPDDAVYVGHENANSGPGWEIWAHRRHVQLLRPDPVAVDILARVLIAKALRADGEATS